MNTAATILILAAGAGAGLYFFKKDYDNIVSNKTEPEPEQTSTIGWVNSAVIDSLPVNSDVPRGVRNNNWLNIEYHASNNWLGQTGSDGRYSIFSDPKWGIRAAAKLLKKYYNTYRLRNVAGIIGRWAPDTENNTSAYTNHVAARLGVSPAAIIAIDDVLPELIHAMAIHECGHGTLPANAQSVIAQGVALA